MAKLRGGILGTVSGKVAGVVAGQWKNKNYVRQYAVPANPNTVAQQTQRSAFASAVSFGKLILGQVINPFVDPFQKDMSGFNWFIKQNIQYFGASIDLASVKITSGKLYPAYADEPTKQGNNVTIEFSGALGLNGAATDKVSCVLFRINNEGAVERIYYPAAAVNRSTGTITVAISAILAPTEFRAYLWCAKYDTKGTLLMVSDSVNTSATLTA